jgi:hypothetical protein
MTISGAKKTPLWTGGSVLVILAALLLGRALTSTGSEDEESTFTVRDSAGVEVVESRRPVWGEGEGWRIGGEAILRIGAMEGDPVYQFSRIAGVARFPDGTLAVGDEVAQELRFFGSDGRFRWSVGRRGEGPGEFTGLAMVGMSPGGWAWAYDFSLRRLTWYDQDGEMMALTSLGLEPPTLNAAGALPNGAFLLKQLWGTGEEGEVNDLGLRRDPLAWVTFDLEGTLIDTVATVPGRELFVFEEDGRAVMSTPPFARNSVGTIRGDRIAVGDQESFEIREYSPAGEVLRFLRIPGRIRRVTDQDLEEYIRGRLASAPPDRHPSLRQSLEGMPHSETLPAYGAILSDTEGNLWVGEWAMYPQVAGSWAVFQEDGRWLGAVEAPPRFDPRAIGEDWILGVEWDELDVEYVVVYPLVKGA